jgi:hypothetical protein
VTAGYDPATTLLDNQIRQEWRSRHTRIQLKKPLPLLVQLAHRLTVPSCDLVEILVTRTDTNKRYATVCDVALHLITDQHKPLTLHYTTRPVIPAGTRAMTELPSLVAALLSHEPNWLRGN